MSECFPWKMSAMGKRELMGIIIAPIRVKDKVRKAEGGRHLPHQRAAERDPNNGTGEGGVSAIDSLLDISWLFL